MVEYLEQKKSCVEKILKKLQILKKFQKKAGLERKKMSEDRLFSNEFLFQAFIYAALVRLIIHLIKLIEYLERRLF